MPRLSVLMIRAALAYLATGFLVGALLLIQRAVSLGNWLPRLVPVHIEYLLLGCIVQLGLGVAGIGTSKVGASMLQPMT